jgi:uncharacterized repeat protein (TIGR01451 family)
MRTQQLTHPKAAFVVLAVGAAVLLAGLLSAADRAAAAFPGDNGKIAFASNRDGNWEIYVMDPDGSAQTDLTSNPADDSQPAWSADGQKLAFASDRDGNSEIYVMNADGSGQTDLTNNAADDSYPAWSPDGKRIAFVRDDSIWVMDAGGSNQARLTDGQDPAWSPDGTKIAFSRSGDIWVMNPDGSGQSKLPVNPNFGASQPDWSPDGTQIAFWNDEVYVMKANGTVLWDGYGDGDPAWSPDGTMIAVDSHQFGIGVRAPDGSHVTDLTSGTPDHWDTDPSWQPLVSSPKFSDLVLRMAGPRRVGPGDPVTYAIRVRNEGPAEANGVAVSDPLPVGTSFVRVLTSRGSCQSPDPASAVLTCSLGSMGDGSHATIIVVARVTGADTTIANTATVSSLTPDPNLTDNSATVVTWVP